IHRSVSFPSNLRLHINSDYPIFSSKLLSTDIPAIPTLSQEQLILAILSGNLSVFNIDTTGMFFESNPNSSFWVSTAGAGCNQQPINVIIEPYSEVKLGSAIGNRSGVLNISNGATLTLQDYSSMVLHNASRVIVKAGSTLEIG